MMHSGKPILLSLDEQDHVRALGYLKDIRSHLVDHRNGKSASHIANLEDEIAWLDSLLYSNGIS